MKECKGRIYLSLDDLDDEDLELLKEHLSEEEIRNIDKIEDSGEHQYVLFKDKVYKKGVAVVGDWMPYQGNIYYWMKYNKEDWR